MRHTMPSEAQTALTSSSLGTLLDQIENIQGKIGLGFGKSAIEILYLLDQADERLKKIQENGMPLSSEEAQYSSIIELFRRQTAQLIHEAGGISVIERARAAENPPEENWWWWPERIVSQKRSDALKKAAKTGAIVFVVLLIVIILYQVFLKPDPKVMAAQEAVQSAEQTAGDGDLQ